MLSLTALMYTAKASSVSCLAAILAILISCSSPRKAGHPSDLVFEHQDECINPLEQSQLWRSFEGVIEGVDTAGVLMLRTHQGEKSGRRDVVLAGVNVGSSALAYLQALGNLCTSELTNKTTR